jgi:tRNA threonylcarbamoyladenosine biosynthesis protein TsaE
MITKNEIETKVQAAKFAKSLKGGELVLLVGDLGSGKTTFVRGFVEAMGSHVRVKSPTFTVMNEYPVDGEYVKRVVHLDLYRMQEDAELFALHLDDELRRDTVIFIEWPDRLQEKVLDPDYTIHLKFIDEKQREIEVERHD